MGSQDFAMVQGDDHILDVAVVDDDGVAIDLTGATLNWAYADTALDTAKATKSTADDITITDAVNGLCEVAIEPADTAGESGKHYHEMQLTDSVGTITTILTGNMTIAPGLI